MDLRAYGEKLAVAPLKQFRHDGAFHLTESRNRFRSFAYAFAMPHHDDTNEFRIDLPELIPPE